MYACGVVSDYFLAINGVKQWAVLSHVLFCLYIYVLLMALSKAGARWFIGNNFVGVFAYANNITLPALLASVLRIMLVISDDYATEYSISFSGSKSKCFCATW